MFATRLNRLNNAMNSAGLDAVALNPGPSLTYLTGLHLHLMERPTVAIFPREGKPVRGPARAGGPGKPASCLTRCRSSPSATTRPVGRASTGRLRAPAGWTGRSSGLSRCGCGCSSCGSWK